MAFFKKSTSIRVRPVCLVTAFANQEKFIKRKMFAISGIQYPEADTRGQSFCERTTTKEGSLLLAVDSL